MRKDPSLYIFDRQPMGTRMYPGIGYRGSCSTASIDGFQCLCLWQYIPVAHLRVVCSGYIDVARQAEEMIVETKYAE
jgi:hypothetical protein